MSWDLTEEDFSVAGKGTTVAAPPPAPVDTTTSSSGNDSTSSSSSDSAAGGAASNGTNELKRELIDPLMFARQNPTATPQELMTATGASAKEAETAILDAQKERDPSSVTAGMTADQIAAENKAKADAEAMEFQQKATGGLLAVAGLGVAAETAGNLAGTLGDSFGTGLNEKPIFKEPVIDVAAMLGIKENQPEGVSNLSASSSPELANNGLGLASGIMGGNTMLSGNAQSILADIGEFKLDTAQFSSLSPSVMAAANREGSNLLSRVEGVRDLDSVSAAVDDSVRANAGVGASVGQSQGTAVATR
jgi:hypothetical protein